MAANGSLRPRVGRWGARIVALALALAATAPGSAAAQGQHGFALFSPLKYADGFDHFDYVNPAAPKGGTVRQGTLLSFNSLNIMQFPGAAPNELMLTFDSLMVRTQDELASFYGLIAERVEIAPAFASARFHLRAEARWHDGTPITARDVAFTFRTLRAHGLPSQRTVLENVEIAVVDERTVLFTPAEPGNWRYLALVASFPIQSARFWSAHDVASMTMAVPLGSGPYRIAALDPNRQVVLERVPDYWAADLAVNRGRWNIDRVETFYFGDRVAMIDALKAGKLDINREFDAARWVQSYTGGPFERGALIRSTWAEGGGGRLDALVFNLRRPPLDDARVRAALGCVFDTGWVRRALFAGVYDPPGSLYGSTEMAARGAAGPGERALLAPYLATLPDGLLDAPGPAGCTGLSRRSRIRHADTLLREAGWIVVDGVRVEATSRTPLALTFVGGYTGLERALPAYREALGTLGIQLSVRLHDYITVRSALLSHDFDITQSGFSPGFPPGGAEHLGWHSANARVDGYALAGAEDPALDAAIQAMTTARDLDAILAATRSFDRVMRWRQYLVPLWRRDRIWIAHDARLRFPASFTLRRFGHLSTLWWE